MKKLTFLAILSGIIGIGALWSIVGTEVSKKEEISIRDITPCPEHRQYWSYNGNDILLLGGSVEDNLFQLSDVEKHLDLLVSVGGNYVRNTMSSRDTGNRWPFYMNADGLYELNRWDELYWERFENFLKATAEREIIVQIEVWATFDFYRENWLKNPFNPENNINYDIRRTKLSIEVDSHPVFAENNFFRSVPSQLSILQLLEFQQKYVDKILEYTMDYNHILYCIDNETSVSSDWGKFWADYIRKIGSESGKFIQVTEMWDPWDLNHLAHRETMDNPDIFSFVDISQNNHNSGEKHWENGMDQIQHLKNINALRPCNNVKVYGNDSGRHQTTQNGVESFIRNVMFGSASSRFHRPTSGQGLNETAQNVIKSVRMITDEMDFFNGNPLNDFITEKEDNEAYCRGIDGTEYWVYFPSGGEIVVIPDAMNRKIRWLDVEKGKWEGEAKLDRNESEIKCPDMGNWFALIKYFQ